jgi:anti-sigma-K factor RskA
VPTHCDPDDLALMALGESTGSPSDAEHLASCAECRAEVDGLRAVVEVGRAADPVVEAPPGQVWTRVAAELGLSRAVAAPAPNAADGAAREAPYDAPVPLDARRRTSGRGAPTWRMVWAVGAAAAVLGVLATLGVDAVTRSDDTGPVVARVALSPLPAHRGTGTASVVGSGARRSLDVDVTGLTKADGYYEVWLLDKNAKKLVSLGLLRGRHGSFTLPADVDLRAFPVVDVSIEPADGNPAHSGNSVVRGQLPS